MWDKGRLTRQAREETNPPPTDSPDWTPPGTGDEEPDGSDEQAVPQVAFLLSMFDEIDSPGGAHPEKRRQMAHYGLIPDEDWPLIRRVMYRGIEPL